MKIIFAQGNPGKEYENTRHNIGFLALDYLKKELADFQDWKKSAKVSAQISEGAVEGEKVILVKPQTYYNETGRVARGLIDFYKLNPQKDILVIHDELAIPFGNIRTREQGSDAGNNGIKSLNSHLGNDYSRIKVGIYNELRDKMPDPDFVLSRLSLPEKTELQTEILPIVKQLSLDFIKGKFDGTTVKIKK